MVWLAVVYVICVWCTGIHVWYLQKKLFYKILRTVIFFPFFFSTHTQHIWNIFRLSINYNEVLGTQCNTEYRRISWKNAFFSFYSFYRSKTNSTQILNTLFFQWKYGLMCFKSFIVYHSILLFLCNLLK